MPSCCLQLSGRALAPAPQRTPARPCTISAAPMRKRLARSTTVQVAAAWGQLRNFGTNPEPEDRFRSLFSAPWIPPSNNPASVYDARDALETCSGLWGEARRECLSVFGLDARQVDTFYSAVFSLEQALSQDTDPEEEAYHRGQERC